MFFCDTFKCEYLFNVHTKEVLPVVLVTLLQEPGSSLHIACSTLCSIKMSP